MRAWVLPVSTPIDQVFSWCVTERCADRLLLSARLEKGAKARKVGILSDPPVGDIVSSLFGSNLLERRFVRKWPGTELVGHKGVIFRIAFETSLIDPMARVGKRLADWQHSHKPPLPEDPCLFRQGDTWPILVSVTHEGDAWILSEERPPLCTGKSFDFSPESLLVPSAETDFMI